MPEPRVVVGLLLVLGPVLGLIPVAHPALIPVWSAPRERHLAIVSEHRRAWWWLNAGFGVATLATAGALVALPGIVADPGTRAGLEVAAVGYTTAGLLWCIVLAIRARVTPALGELVAMGAQTEPAEQLLGSAQSGLFAGYALGTGIALVALGTVLFLGGVVTPPIAILQLLAGVGIVGWLLAAGDVIPAALYLPTIALGAALLWR